jgi:hypothetical protein
MLLTIFPLTRKCDSKDKKINKNVTKKVEEASAPQASVKHSKQV